MHRPMNNRVILKLERAFQHAGLIHIPETALTDRLQYGRVMAVGEGEWRRTIKSTRDEEGVEIKRAESWERTPIACEVGDLVLFNRRAAIEYDDPDDGEKYLMCEEKYLEAVIEGATK